MQKKILMFLLQAQAFSFFFESKPVIKEIFVAKVFDFISFPMFFRIFKLFFIVLL